MKKLTLLALAAVTMSAFAQDTTTTDTTQSTTTTTTTTQTTSPTQTTTTTSQTTHMGPGGMNYNMSASSSFDRRQQVMDNIKWLGAGDQYYFQKMLSMATGPEEHAIIKAVYNLGGWATQLRWEKGVARMNQEWPTYTYNRTTTTQSTTDSSGTTSSQTTTTWTAPSTMYTWDTNSDSARPLRFIYEAQPRTINYTTALEVLNSGLDSSEQGMLNHWWVNADERSKDIMVRLINRQLMWADTAPMRIHYMDSYRDVQR